VQAACEASSREQQARDAVASAVDALLPSERELLGLLDICGPLDARALALAMRCQMTIVFAMLRHLNAAGLVVQKGHFDSLSPTLVRWLAARDAGACG
jgi:hypothetical protein